MCPVSMRAVFTVAIFLLCASTSFAFYGLSKVSPSGDFLIISLWGGRGSYIHWECGSKHSTEIDPDGGPVFILSKPLEYY